MSLWKRKLRRVPVSDRLLIPWFTTGYEYYRRSVDGLNRVVVKEGIPATAKVKDRVAYNYDAIVEYVLWDESFDPVPEGEVIPVLGVVCEEQSFQSCSIQASDRADLVKRYYEEWLKGQK